VVQTFQQIYGKRIIIMGGGAAGGQVAIGAISEADRHTTSAAEHISVDTIPLVGEQPLATPCARWPACPGPGRWSWPAP